MSHQRRATNPTPCRGTRSTTARGVCPSRFSTRGVFPSQRIARRGGRSAGGICCCHLSTPSVMRDGCTRHSLAELLPHGYDEDTRNMIRADRGIQSGNAQCASQTAATTANVPRCTIRMFDRREPDWVGPPTEIWVPQMPNWGTQFCQTCEPCFPARYACRLCPCLDCVPPPHPRPEYVAFFATHRGPFDV